MRRIWEEITKFAVEHKPHLKQFWHDADGQINGFMQNDVVLGQCWDGPPARLKKVGQPVTMAAPVEGAFTRSEEHTSELQSLMRISSAVFCLTIKINLPSTTPSN